MDRSLGIWLMIIFGLSGMAVILFAWLAPSSLSSRVMATVTGSVGVIIAAARGFTLRQTGSQRSETKVSVEVAADNS